MKHLHRSFFVVALAAGFASAGWAQSRVSSGVIERTWEEMLRADALVMPQVQQRLVRAPRRVAPAELNAPASPQTLVIPPSSSASPGRQTTVMATPAPETDFDGLLDNTHVIPPDTYGAVGLTHVMTMLNSDVRIQDKSGTTLSTVTLESFWSAGVGSVNLSDPHVLFDVTSGRWVASILVDPDTSTSRIGVAVSATEDPTGVWRFLTFLSQDTTVFPDYPALGFNNQWIVISANVFKTTAHGGTYQGPCFWAIDKAAALLPSGTVTAVRFNTGYDSPNTGFTEQPMICYTPSDTLWFVESGRYTSGVTQLIRLSNLTGSSTSPAWSPNAGSTISGTGFFPVVNNFKQPPNGATQKGSTQKIDNGDARASGAVYRNGHVWFANSGGLPLSGTVNRTAAFWYEIDPRSTSPIVQSGVVDPGTNSHLMCPSIAVNTLNTACVGFTHSDTSRYAEAAYTVRQAADPSGTMQGIALLKAGQGVYYKTFGSGRNRWGDFSSTVVDPVDSLTFWTIQEYAGTPVGSVTTDGSGRWATHWGKIVVDVPLPVQLTSFTGALAENGAVALSWTTASEIDCYGFSLERGTTAENFTAIPGGFCAGHGTTAQPHTYAFTDKPGAPGAYYYRLTEIDLSGAQHAFDPLRVSMLTSVTQNMAPLQSELFQNFPNPFNPSTTIAYTIAGVRSQGSGVREVRIVIYDLLGREVATLVDARQAPGAYTVKFDGSQLASGVYFCRIAVGSYSAMKAMVLEK